MNNEKDIIYRQDAIDEIDEWIEAFRENGHRESAAYAWLIRDGIIRLPSAQPTFEEVPATTFIKEMSPTTTHSTFLWLDIFEKMNEMGYVICKRKKM